ncbi:Branched-chain amino acid transport system / permease component family protein [Candidatus Desulfosporosinus infrequens]|uniref:Branched-chain amino acid transport system / permease component family protein n=1 Tax=Candidatus Desulfosporosinus infrequens TaxID=2043169 RepID=A0A2U3KDB6_9FIRM|nr:Branched-chain amino acid transport system / permease component family protein [Candidatus Desulfosporosinus infrequens]
MQLRRMIIPLIVLAILLALPPVLPRYYLYLLASIFVTALLATSLNFILGYGGLLQLHHAVFFGVGAYTFSILMIKTSLPFGLAVIAGPVTATVIAFVIGWFCVRLRGLYFGMLTLALGQLVWAIIFRWSALTGGDDGLHGIPVPEIFSSLQGTYYISLGVLTVCLGVLYLILKSPFGLILLATRDNPERCESVGINIRRHRLAAFMIAGFFAGIAGVLFVLVEKSVSPSILTWGKSAEIMIMCLLGGLNTFFGPTLGAAVIVFLSMKVGAYTEYWLLVLGIILLVLVLVLPQGILGFWEEKFIRPQADKEGLRKNVTD